VDESSVDHRKFATNTYLIRGKPEVIPPELSGKNGNQR
jgi:hypothetical protein